MIISVGDFDFDFGVGAGGKLRALLFVLLAIFMAALAVGIVAAPMNMHPVLAFLLKGFILLTFGAIVAGCLISALRSKPRDAIAAEALERCLTCGEKSPSHVACPTCAEAPQQRASAFSVGAQGMLGASFVSILFAGIGCLGLFVMIGPYLDGERRIWALIAFFALGLLMFAVGVVGIGGFLILLRDSARGANPISFSCHSPARHAQGSGKVAWRRLLWLQGTGTVHAPLSDHGRPEGGYRSSQGDCALAEMIATFDAAGLFDLFDVTTYHWQLGDPSAARGKPLEFRRKTQRMVMMVPRDSRGEVIPFDDFDHTLEDIPPKRPAHIDVHRFLSRFLVTPMSLLAFKASMDADPIHRSQAEMHARMLRERGILPVSELVDAVVQGLAQD